MSGRMLPEKFKLRDNEEHNLPSFRAKLGKWIDPTKEAVTPEMIDFINSCFSDTLTKDIAR